MTLTKIPKVSWLVASLFALSACGGGSTSTATDTGSNNSGTNTNTSSGSNSSGSNTSSGSNSSGTTADVLCSYASSVFNTSASVHATSTATWSCSGGKRSLTANGLPDHAVGAFPNANNPNTIAAQTVSFSATLTPIATSTVTPRTGPFSLAGYVLNGVPIDPATAGTCDNSGARCDLASRNGAWDIEALGQSHFNFGTDANNAHVQPGGVYHYHGVPEGFVSQRQKGSAMTLIGWAADGFPIYARYGYTVTNDASSAIKVMKSSYRTKATADASRPATSLYAMGTFKQDYEYVAGLGDLDECNGRTGVTPEFPQGVYHYYATDSYPFLQRCVKGKL